jgi:predicted amino acid dehydrogenase
LVQYLCQIAVSAVGYPADLGGDVAALDDEAVVDGGLLEHDGAVSL